MVAKVATDKTNAINIPQFDVSDTRSCSVAVYGSGCGCPGAKSSSKNANSAATMNTPMADMRRRLDVDSPVVRGLEYGLLLSIIVRRSAPQSASGGHHRGRANDSTIAEPLGSRPSVDVMVIACVTKTATKAGKDRAAPLVRNP